MHNYIRQILLFFILLLYSNINAQFTINKHYDNDSLLDVASAVIQTKDNGYILAGNTYDFFLGWDASFFIKADNKADIEWVKVYDISSTGGDAASSIIQLSDQNYIIFGHFQDTILLKKDVYLLKLDNDGNQLWFKAYGGTDNEGSYMVKETVDYGFIFVGYTTSYTNGGVDIYLVKTDSAGNVEWEKNYGGLLDEVAYSVDLTNDGGYILGGRTSSYGLGGPDDLYLVKVDSAGNFKWQKTYGTPQDDYGETVIQTFDGGFIFAGNIKDVDGNYDAYVVKTDSAGNIEWDKSYGTTQNYEGVKYAKQLSDSSYILSGSLWESDELKHQGWLLKITSTGDSVWAKTFGNPGVSDYFYDMQLTSDGGYVMGGQWNRIGPPYQDMWLVKTDSLGNTCEIIDTNDGCWDFDCDYLIAVITQSADTVDLSVSATVGFYDNSTFAESWFWDFDDGTTDTIQNPIHTFADTGTHIIMLVAGIDDCFDTAYTTVTVVNSVGINEQLTIKNLTFFIYPNPAGKCQIVNGKWKMENGITEGEIEIFNIYGKKVYEKKVYGNKGDMEISLENLEAGIYIVQLRAEEGILARLKLIIN